MFQILEADCEPYFVESNACNQQFGIKSLEPTAWIISLEATVWNQHFGGKSLESKVCDQKFGIESLELKVCNAKAGIKSVEPTAWNQKFGIIVL